MNCLESASPKVRLPELIFATGLDGAWNGPVGGGRRNGGIGA